MTEYLHFNRFRSWSEQRLAGHNSTRLSRYLYCCHLGSTEIKAADFSSCSVHLERAASPIYRGMDLEERTKTPMDRTHPFPPGYMPVDDKNYATFPTFAANIEEEPSSDCCQHRSTPCIRPHFRQLTVLYSGRTKRPLPLRKSGAWSVLLRRRRF
jgi:hypothetical protein